MAVLFPIYQKRICSEGYHCRENPIIQGDFAKYWTCRCNCLRVEEAHCRNILYSYAPQMTMNKDQPYYKFLSANKELLLSKARKELEKRLLKVIIFS